MWKKSFSIFSCTSFFHIVEFGHSPMTGVLSEPCTYFQVRELHFTLHWFGTKFIGYSSYVCAICCVWWCSWISMDVKLSRLKNIKSYAVELKDRNWKIRNEYMSKWELSFASYLLIRTFTFSSRRIVCLHWCCGFTASFVYNKSNEYVFSKFIADKKRKEKYSFLVLKWHYKNWTDKSELHLQPAETFSWHRLSVHLHSSWQNPHSESHCPVA